MTLAACCLTLVARPWDPQVWCLQLFTIDKNPGAKLFPGIAHDLELSCDGLQLARASVTNFYCEFFHTLNLIGFCSSGNHSPQGSSDILCSPGSL